MQQRKAQRAGFAGPVLVSSEIGVQKPAAGSFEKLLRVLETAPEESWYVGDDPDSDIAGAHAAAAALTGMEAAAVYRLLEGSANPGRTTAATWVSPARGHERPALAELLGDGIDPEHDSLWQRCLVLGPAPEYCLHACEVPAGVSPARLPSGWNATTVAHEAIWSG